MRILFVAPHLPYPPRRGAAIRNYHFLRWMATRHEVSLLTFGAREQVDGHLRELCAQVRVVPPPARTASDRVRDLATSPYPDLPLRLRSAPFAAELRRWLAEDEFEAVQLECLETTWSWLWTLRHLPAGTRRPHAVFDNHNAEYLLQWRAFLTDVRLPRRWPAAAYSLVQAVKLRRYEARLCATFDRVVAVSDHDARALTRLGVTPAPLVVPNGVDCAFFTPAPEATQGVRPPRLVFTGTMDYRPNVDAVVWFAREVWPRLRARVPEAEFLIVGASPAPAVQALNAVPGITVTGAVDDVRPYVWGSALYVVPLRVGGGTRLKVLEAMASGVPLVSTALGCEGLAVEPGIHYFRADDAPAFADAASRVLLDEVDTSSMVRAARLLVEREYDWSALSPRLAAVLPTAR